MRLISRIADRVSDEQQRRLTELGVWFDPGGPKHGISVCYFNAKSEKAGAISEVIDTRYAMTRLSYSASEVKGAQFYVLGSESVFGELRGYKRPVCSVCGFVDPPAEGLTLSERARRKRKRVVLSAPINQHDVFFASRKLIDRLAQALVHRTPVSGLPVPEPGSDPDEPLQICAPAIDPAVEWDISKASGFDRVYGSPCGHEFHKISLLSIFRTASDWKHATFGFRRFRAAASFLGRRDTYYPVVVDSEVGRALMDASMEGCKLKPVFRAGVDDPSFDETPLTLIEDWAPDF